MRVLLCNLLLVLIVWASRGDQEEEYLECLSACLKVHQCSSPTKQPSSHYHPASPWLRTLGWTCRDECRYECMWEVVRERRIHGLPIEQYHGKWPFVRLLGIQEPASVLFSILNGLAHLWGLFAYGRMTKTHNWLLTAYAGVAVNAWIWSTVFHTRDTDWTETMDYFSAAGLLFFSILLTAGELGFRGPRLALMAILLGGCFVRHVYYLGWIKFDYGYNMAVMVSLGLLFNFTWFVWAAMHWKQYPRSAKLILCWTILATLAGALELLEFNPFWDTFDAHSLWHAATIPLSYGLYRILALRSLEQQHQIRVITKVKTVKKN